MSLLFAPALMQLLAVCEPWCVHFDIPDLVKAIATLTHVYEYWLMLDQGIKGKEGLDLNDYWEAGIKTNLGMIANGYPNFFMYVESLLILRPKPNADAMVVK